MKLHYAVFFLLFNLKNQLEIRQQATPTSYFLPDCLTVYVSITRL